MNEILCAENIDLDALILYMEQGNAIRFPDAKLFGDIITRIQYERPDVYFRYANKWPSTNTYLLGINRYNHRIMNNSNRRDFLNNWDDICHVFCGKRNIYPDVTDLI